MRVAIFLLGLFLTIWGGSNVFDSLSHQYVDLVLFILYVPIALLGIWLCRKSFSPNLKSEIYPGKSKEYLEKTFAGRSLIGMGIIIFIISIFFFSDSDKNIKQSELIAVVGILDANLELTSRKFGKRKRIPNMNFSLKEYPETKFEMSRNTLTRTDINALISEKRIGDKVGLYIHQDDYRKNISREIPLTFWEKHSGVPSIRVFGVTSVERSYTDLSFEYVYVKRDESPLWKWLFPGVSIFSIFFGRRMLKEARRL